MLRSWLSLLLVLLVIKHGDMLGLVPAKNLVLAGVKSVTLHDDANVELWDLSSNFFLSEKDVGQNRAQACVQKLQELNSAVIVSTLTGDLTKEHLPNFQTEKKPTKKKATCLSTCSRSHRPLLTTSRSIYSRNMSSGAPLSSAASQQLLNLPPSCAQLHAWISACTSTFGHHGALLLAREGHHLLLSACLSQIIRSCSRF